MGKSLNQVTLLGNLTRDPELRQTPTGQQVVSFSLALNSNYKNKEGNWEERVEYVDCTAWQKLAENVATYTKRGSKVLVQGRLQSRSWEQDGQKKSKVEVLANDVTFMDSKGDNPSPAPAPAKTDNANLDDDSPINLDDIPF